MPNYKAAEQGRVRRLAILAFVRAFWKDNGYSPSTREIGLSLGITSPNAVHAHLRRLVEDGFITTVPGVARSIALTAKGRRAT